jgi:cell division protein FtsX
MTMRWILRRARREARRRKLGLAALAVAMAVAATLGAAGVLGARAGAAALPRLQQQVHVIAYLDDGLPAPERARLVEAVRRIPGVEQARAVEPDEALARLRAAAASLGGPAAIGAVEAGFLPRSVEIAIRPSANLAARTRELADRLRKIAGVGEVDDMSEGLGRLESWLALARRLGLVALALAAIAASAGVAAALVGWPARRREAEVLRLLGEGPLAISLAPSLTGAAAALAGTVIGLALTGALFPRLVVAMEAAVLVGPLGAVPALGPCEVALAVIGAVIVGGAAGHLGARAPGLVRDA